MMMENLFKPIKDMVEYLDSIVEDDKRQLIEDGMNGLKKLFIIAICEGIAIGVLIVFNVLIIRSIFQ